MVVRAVPRGQAINITAYRDIAIRISQQFMRPSSAFASNIQEKRELAAATLNTDVKDSIDKEQWMSYITDLQAVHLLYLAGMFLGFISTAVLGPGISKHKQSLVQAPALRVIQDSESPVMAVMPTGGGKSMLFMLPAFTEPGGVTIIIMIDKCYIILNNQKDFRPELWQLSQLNHACIQIPVVLYPAAMWFETESWTGSGKMIIYSHAVSHITGIIRINKPFILHWFMQGETMVIAAISILGIEVDIPDIYSIIHIGMPRTLLDYVQKSK
ncbi:uncharacterized protein BDW43DRAFT_303550 [Aspergillus alliaceus]|uniref:uncharacterized protein n=1 Tax=Petromyces alliaceus TaxID=209559 RepID=UPI0012A695BF|nr:uncharacterized protein BDW43DRAFT_303550 [Aspergillus alliaceus]KAB8228839.1 hypothetical protein BDW43DRAFT_303550 [Aspergillus alliaceus]